MYFFKNNNNPCTPCNLFVMFSKHKTMHTFLVKQILSTCSSVKILPANVFLHCVFAVEWFCADRTAWHIFAWAKTIHGEFLLKHLI